MNANPQLNACCPMPSKAITALSKAIRETNDKITELSGLFRAKHA